MSYLGEDIKKLGFGLMRLPGEHGKIDIERTKEMVDAFIAKGFTYFDTAYMYYNGESEKAAKIALVDRYPRESYQLATKLPAWHGANSAQEARDMFRTSLERTGAGYFDFYLLHNLGGINNTRTEIFEEYKLWDFVAEQKAAGRIKHMGFSLHARADVLDEVLTKHPETEFVQLQINYADWENGAIESRKCYETARRHGKPIIIMEPVKGGALAKLPEAAAKILSDANPAASPASWAIRFAASLDGIITVLSGMSNMEQMTDNMSYMRDFKPLTAAERATVEAVQRALEGIPQIPCTNCRYCVKDCPQNILIPDVFEAMNDYLIYKDTGRAKNHYGFEVLSAGSARAAACVECGQCESVCPQSIGIIEELRKAAEVLDINN